MTEKKNYHHPDLKSQLIAQGLKLLDQEGYEGFSLRKVAKLCNVSHTAPYRHFKNKDELIMAIALEAQNKFDECLREGAKKHPDDPVNQLREMGYSYIKFFVENPQYFRLIFFSDLNQKLNINCKSTPDANYSQDGNNIGQPFQTFSQGVAKYRAEKEKKGQNVIGQDGLILYCWGLVHGISILIAKKEFGYDGNYLDLARKIIWSDSFLA